MELNDETYKDLINEVYTPIQEIEEELKRRRADPVLLKKVEDFLGNFMLPEFKSAPRAIISRTVMTPNFEFKYFIDIAQDLELSPLCLEYYDKFVANNSGKYHLGKMYFFDKSNGTHSVVIAKTILDFNMWEGGNVESIKTHWSESLIDFHHFLMQIEHPDLDTCRTDITKWFNQVRTIDEYYLFFLSHFICHGVLFENYLLKDQKEIDFFFKKIYPGFKKAEKLFGVKPLIYPLLPIEHEKHAYWESYPKRLMSIVELKLKNLL